MLLKNNNYFSFQRNKNSIHALDGLRGIAILLVLGRHAFRGYFPENHIPNEEWSLWNVLANGWMGVDLFFVLSGFLISFHITQRYISAGKIINYKDFLKRRFLRIAPTYYFVLLVIVTGIIPFYEFNYYDVSYRIAYHLMFLQDYLSADINVAFWSLGVEEKFYLISPLILFGVFKTNKLVFQYAILILLILLPMLLRMLSSLDNGHDLTYVAYFYTYRSPFHLTFDGLAIGMLCALIYNHRDKYNLNKNLHINQISFWLGFIVIALVLLSEAHFSYISKFDIVYLEFLVASGFGLILIGAVFNGGPICLLRSKTLFYFSKISYPLYLVHLPLIPLSIYITKNSAIMNYMNFQNNFYIFTIVFITLSTVTATIIHFVIEKPFLIIKDNIKQA